MKASPVSAASLLPVLKISGCWRYPCTSWPSPLGLSFCHGHLDNSSSMLQTGYPLALLADNLLLLPLSFWFLNAEDLLAAGNGHGHLVCGHSQHAYILLQCYYLDIPHTKLQSGLSFCQINKKPDVTALTPAPACRGSFGCWGWPWAS